MATSQSEVLEIYRLFVETADRISARRGLANSFFLAALSTLVVVGASSQAPTWSVAVPGVVVSAIWWRLLGSYRELNSAKYRVIHEIEKKLALSPYTDEWSLIMDSERGRFRVPYFGLGKLEQVVPIVYCCLFVVLVIWD